MGKVEWRSVRQSADRFAGQFFLGYGKASHDFFTRKKIICKLFVTAAKIIKITISNSKISYKNNKNSTF